MEKTAPRKYDFQFETCDTFVTLNFHQGLQKVYKQVKFNRGYSCAKSERSHWQNLLAKVLVFLFLSPLNTCRSQYSNIVYVTLLTSTRTTNSLKVSLTRSFEQNTSFHTGTFKHHLTLKTTWAHKNWYNASSSMMNTVTKAQSLDDPTLWQQLGKLTLYPWRKKLVT